MRITQLTITMRLILENLIGSTLSYNLSYKIRHLAFSFGYLLHNYFLPRCVTAAPYCLMDYLLNFNPTFGKYYYNHAEKFVPALQDDVIKIETFSTLLTLCAGNSPVTGEFPSQRPVTRSFDAFFHLRLNKRLSKQWCGW